jgi:predicted O-methyltransferase YrrM
MSGFKVNVNGKEIYGYSRYIHFYSEIVANSKDGDLFVEVGSFLGQSTAAMGKFIKDTGKRIDFHAVDIFELSEFSDEPHYQVIKDHGGHFLKVFEDNLEGAQVREYVNPVQSTSLDASEKYEDRSIDFLMIDASHAYQDVVDDIEAWYPKIKLGGIISGDDYDFEEVAKAVADTCGTAIQVYPNTTWWFRKQFINLEDQKSFTPEER